MTRTTIDTRLSTPHHMGGFSVEKKRETLAELMELMGKSLSALQEDYLHLEKENSSLQDQNEQLARELAAALNQIDHLEETK